MIGKPDRNSTSHRMAEAIVYSLLLGALSIVIGGLLGAAVRFFCFTSQLCGG